MVLGNGLKANRGLVFTQSTRMFSSGFAQSTLTDPKREEIKFSAFLKKDKTYVVEKHDIPKETTEPFVAKPEVQCKILIVYRHQG